MISQTEFSLKSYSKGFHLITNEVLSKIGELPQTGILHLFIKHSSAALTINENADPDVRTDLNSVFNKLVPENQTFYTHTFEGEDDMPAHAKSSIIGCDIMIPITNCKLNLGTWQGIYLCEFRVQAQNRRIVATIIG